MELKKTSRVYIYFAAIMAMVFWGLSFIWTSIVFEYYNPITTIFLRLLISSTFLFIIMLTAGWIQKIQRKHFLLFIVSALFNPFLYFLGENFGLKHSTASISAVTISTIPVFTPVIAWLLIREKISLLNIIGILISFTGILLMLVNPDFSFATHPKGILLLLSAVLSAVIYSILLKKLTDHYSPISIIAWQNLLGAILFLPLFTSLEMQSFIEVSPDRRLITTLLSLAILSSSMAYIFFTYSIKHLGVSRANVYSNLIPVITAIASYYMLGEIFPWWKIAGMAIVISGVIITQLNNIKFKK
ncbi:MAG: DMT family transporter [Bacteroidota bacterium]